MYYLQIQGIVVFVCQRFFSVKSTSKKTSNYFGMCTVDIRLHGNSLLFVSTLTYACV